MGNVIAVITGVLAGVCAGYSGVFLLRKPKPGWTIATVLALWLTLLYNGVWGL